MMTGYLPFYGVWNPQDCTLQWELHPKLLRENVQWNEVLWPIHLGSMDWIQSISYLKQDSFITLDNNSLSSKLE